MRGALTKKQPKNAFMSDLMRENTQNTENSEHSKQHIKLTS